MFSGPLQKDLLKGKWNLAKSCFKQNYCPACHTRFAVFLSSSPVLLRKFTTMNWKRNRKTYKLKTINKFLESITFRESRVFALRVARGTPFSWNTSCDWTNHHKEIWPISYGKQYNTYHIIRHEVWFIHKNLQAAESSSSHLIVAASVTLAKLNRALLTIDKQGYGKPPGESRLLATNCQTRT